MVPEGLVLLTSVAFAVGVVRLAQRRCLVQELPALVDKLDSTLSQLESASKNANGILNENRDSWAEFSQDGLGQVGPTMRQLRGLIREIDDLANKLENNPAGYLLGREEPEEFEP